MQRFDILIQRFWDHNITQHELGELRDLLEQQEHLMSAEMKEDFYELISKQAGNIEPMRAAGIMHTMRGKIGVKKRASIIRISDRGRWLAAASVMIVCASLLLLIGRSGEKKNVAVADGSVRTHTERTSLHNESDTIMPVVLTDGSLVKLYPNSSVSFSKRFMESHRDIELQGKAFFKVAKDSSRPFTVYANHFSTTALGTAFTVDAERLEGVSVKLFEGKVVIRAKDKRAAWTDQYLIPNEEFAYSLRSETFTISHFGSSMQRVNHNTKEKEKERVAAETIQENGTMVFNNASLKKVLGSLATGYKVRFEYNKADLAGLYFTGSFSKEDELRNIMSIICNINGLVFAEQDEQTIIITKSK